MTKTYQVQLTTTILALDDENAAWIAQTIATNRGLTLTDVTNHEQQETIPSEQLGGD